MVNILTKMFAEQRLAFLEGTNRFTGFFLKIPVLRDKLDKEKLMLESSKGRLAIGIFAYVCRILSQFIFKLLYVAVAVYIPYLLLSIFCPLVKSNEEMAVCFIFFMLSTLCGSFANNNLMSIGDRDYLMVRVIQISPYMNFLGKLFERMIGDFIYFTIILLLFGVSVKNSLLLSFVTMCARPLGEMISLVIFEHMESLYKYRNILDGAVMALSVILAYGIPVLKRRISSSWLLFQNYAFVAVMFILGCLSIYYLWNYKYYRKVMREAIFISSWRRTPLL